MSVFDSVKFSVICAGGIARANRECRQLDIATKYKQTQTAGQQHKMPDITSLDSQIPEAVSTDPASHPGESLQDPEDGRDAIPGHPLGVKPSGNALLAAENLRDAIGTFGILPDELILILLEFLDGPSLLRIGRTCKAFYAFTRAEDLWKNLFAW